MATVEFRYDPKNTAWFTANAAMVLKAGEPAYHDTTGLFKLGDGVTALSALSFLPTVSASTPTIQQVLTAGQVATTTIETTGFIKTGGTSAQFLKADGTVDSNVYGVGNALTTNPLSQFAATTSSQLAGVISDETGTGALVFGTSPTFTTDITTPLVKNTNLNLDATSGSLILKAFGVSVQTVTFNKINYTPSLATTGAVNHFQFTVPASTAQTAGANIANFICLGNNKQWATGALATQYFNYFTANTVSFVGASTASQVYGMFIEGATAGTNATITNNFALGLSSGTATIKIGNLTGSTTDAAIYFNQGTPSGSNYGIYATALRTDLNATTSVNLTIAGSTHLGLSSTLLSLGNGVSRQIAIVPQAISGASTIGFQVTNPSHTNILVGTNLPSFRSLGSTQQWATGALATQYFNHFTANTVSFVGASTATNVYNLFVEAPIAGTNATITNNYAAGFDGRVILTSATGGRIDFVASNSYVANVGANMRILGGEVFIDAGGATSTIRTTNTLWQWAAGLNMSFGTGTGTKIGTATNQLLSFWNATPIVQPTTAVAAAAFVANAGTAVNDASTFDGYTLGKVVKALRNAGLLA
jgi:hypothetical protein